MQNIPLHVDDGGNIPLSVPKQEQTVSFLQEPVRVINAVSPTAVVEQTEDGALLTVHDLHGTTTAILQHGPQGPKGDKGDIGETGPQGVQGEQGIQGPKGDKGDRGETGERGPQGIQGERGETGPQGVKGDTGERGPQGVQGERGDKGDTGDRGETGAAGYTPVRGTDYWTMTDQQAVIQAAIDAVLAVYPAAEGVSW